MLPLWLTAASLAATLRVGEGGYGSLQEAVDAASAGDTVEVAAGTWEESVVVGKDLVILGPDGAADTWLVSEGTALITVDARVSVSGLTLAGATRGLWAQGGEVAVADAVITGVRHGGDGGGVRADGATLTLEGVRLEGNRVDAHRGAHLFALDSQVEIDDCAFRDGRAREGGAIYAEGGSLTVAGSRFEGHSVRADPEAGAAAGGAVRVVETWAQLTDCVFEDNTATEGTGGHLASLDAEVELRDSSLLGGEASGRSGGAITADGGSLRVEGCLIESNTAVYAEDGSTGHGGGVRIEGGASWALVSSIFDANVGEGWGGAVSVDSGEGLIDDCTFTGNYAYYGAGAYLRAREDAVVEDSRFSDNEARYGAALRWIPSSSTTELRVEGCRFEDNDALGYGGVLYARSAGHLLMLDCTAQGHDADVGGALMLWSVAEVELRRNSFCSNRARSEDYSDGGAVNLYYVDEAVVENNAFVENRADVWGGALSSRHVDALRLVNNTFLGNESRTEGGGGAVALRSTDAAVLRNDVLAWTGGGAALYADDADALDLGWSAWWENLEDELAGEAQLIALGEDHLLVDPQIAAWSADHDCSNDRLWLSWRSALRDAGDPELLDPDGTRSDMGAYGGPGADPALFEDGDGDGHPWVYDCDDADPDAWPGAEEVPYDGVDQDCDGEDLVDEDEDGHAATAAGGDDCDDTDPSVHPGVVDRWYDGVDSDCDGADDFDADGDGYAYVGAGGEDCDDLRADVHPEAPDPPGDGVDQDCDGSDAGIGEEPSGCASSGLVPLGWAALLLLLTRRRRLSTGARGSSPCGP